MTFQTTTVIKIVFLFLYNKNQIKIPKKFQSTCFPIVSYYTNTCLRFCYLNVYFSSCTKNTPKNWLKRNVSIMNRFCFWCKKNKHLLILKKRAKPFYKFHNDYKTWRKASLYLALCNTSIVLIAFDSNNNKIHYSLCENIQKTLDHDLLGK